MSVGDVGTRAGRVWDVPASVRLVGAGVDGCCAGVSERSGAVSLAEGAVLCGCGVGVAAGRPGAVAFCRSIGGVVRGETVRACSRGALVLVGGCGKREAAGQANAFPHPTCRMEGIGGAQPQNVREPSGLPARIAPYNAAAPRQRALCPSAPPRFARGLHLRGVYAP